MFSLIVHAAPLLKKAPGGNFEAFNDVPWIFPSVGKQTLWRKTVFVR
jgi:hypothetical protein